MKRFMLIVLIILFVQILSAEFAKADTLKGRKYYKLQGIRVVARTPKESIGAITIKPINKETLAKEINMSEAIKDISGISLTSGTKGESNLRIRAFRKEDVKILIDGRSVNGGYFGNVNLNEIPMFDIDEIQIVKGPVSSLYGFNSMGGTVNYITKRADQDDWMKISSVFKRNNTRSSKLSISHDFIDSDFWLNITNNSSDGFVLSKDFKSTAYENGDVRNLADFNNWDFQTKTSFTVLDYNNLGISAGYTFSDKKNVPNSIYEGVYRKFTDWKRYNVSTLLSLMHSEKLESSHQIYFDAYNNRLHEYTDPELTHETLNSLLKSYSLGYEGKFSLNVLNNNKANILLKSEKQYYNRIDNQNYQTKIDNATYSNEISFFDTHNLNDHIELSLGSGFSSSIRDSDNKKYYSPYYAEFCTGISVYDFFSKKIVLGFSKNIQYPTMHELFSSSKGNINLNPEKAYKTELSVTHGFDLLFPVQTTNAVFYNSIKDMIEQKGSRYANLRELENSGIESSVYVRFNDWINNEFNYTYMNLAMNNDYEFYEIPENQINYSLNVKFPYAFILKYNFDYVSDRISPDDDGHLYTLKEHALHGISLSKTYKKNKFMLSVDNLLDTNYQEEYGFPASGINFSLGFESVIF